MRQEDFDKSIRRKLQSLDEPIVSQDDVQRVMFVIKNIQNKLKWYQSPAFKWFFAGLTTLVIIFIFSKNDTNEHIKLDKHSSITMQSHKNQHIPQQNSEFEAVSDGKKGKGNQSIAEQNDLITNQYNKPTNHPLVRHQKQMKEKININNHSISTISSKLESQNIDNTTYLSYNRDKNENINHDIVKENKKITNPTDTSIAYFALNESKSHSEVLLLNDQSTDIIDGVKTMLPDLQKLPSIQYNNLSSDISLVSLSTDHLFITPNPSFERWSIGFMAAKGLGSYSFGLRSEYFLKSRWSLMSGMDYESFGNVSYVNADSYRMETGLDFFHSFKLPNTILTANFITLRKRALNIPIIARYYHPLGKGFNIFGGAGINYQWLNIEKLSFKDNTGVVEQRTYIGSHRKRYNHSFIPSAEIGLTRQFGLFELQLSVGMLINQQNEGRKNDDHEINPDLRLYILRRF